MYAYVVNASIPNTLFPHYFSWLKDHILGNDAKEIKGMLTVKSNQTPIFSRADVYVCDIEDQQKFISIHYIAASMEFINIYLAQFAMVMRGELPEMFQGKVEYSRYIRNIDTTETVILPPENQMHRDILNHQSDKLQLVEVFELA
jgi:hypothetical protein